MLQLRIMNQNISYYATSRIVADSKGYLYFTLETSEEWNEYIKVVQFTRDGKTYDVPDVRPGVQYQVPWEALVNGGTMFVSCYGMAGDANRATTNELEITVYDSGFYEGDPSEDPTPDKYQEFVNQVIDAKRDAESARDEAKSYADAAAEDAKDVTNYADQVYKNTQLSEQAAQKAEQAAGEAEIFSASAQEYAAEAEKSAIAADESEMRASMSEIAAKESENKAKESEENAAQSESNANLSASKAEANQQIVTETKAEIDEIYQNMQNIQTDVTNKHSDVTTKAEQVALQAEQVENWYNNFRTGCLYIDFTSEIIHEEELPTGEIEQVGDWQYDETSELYKASLAHGGNALLSIQMLKNSNYVITAFVDAEITDTMIYLYAIAPFEGRLQVHSLVEKTTESEVEGENNNAESNS